MVVALLFVVSVACLIWCCSICCFYEWYLVSLLWSLYRDCCFV